MLRPPPTSTLFPYTTLFRSCDALCPGGDGLPSAGDLGVPDALVQALARNPRESERKQDRKSTRLNSSHVRISYAVFCLKKKKITTYHRKHRHLYKVHEQLLT